MSLLKMFRYGYKWLGMKEISYEKALDLVDKQEVYLLYDDNTENCVNYEENPKESIKNHYKYGGLFGIERNFQLKNFKQKKGGC